MSRTRCLIAALVPLVLAVGLVSSQEPVGTFKTTDGPDLGGKHAVVDLPGSEHIKNVGGRDGAGLCVFSSTEVAARWQNLEDLRGFQVWMRKRPGGGWPEKLDAMLKQYCREKGVPVPAFIQITGGEEDVLDTAMRTGRCVGVTYAGKDPFYNGQTIAHMVNLAHLDSSDASILDNNEPTRWRWMSRAEFLSRWRANQGGWAVIFLGPPPPPNPGVQVFGQCPNGKCPLPAVPYAPVIRAAPDGWQEAEVNGKTLHRLYKNGTFLGVWDGERWYPAVTADGWSVVASGKPPVDPPVVEAKRIANYGVHSDKVHQGKRYWISGCECSKEVAIAAISADGQLSDDSSKYHLSVVGPASMRQAVLQALASDAGLRAFKEKIHVQCYDPSHWTVAARSLPPGLSLRKPKSQGGTQVWTAGDFTAASLLDGLQRTDPNWKPPAPPTPVDPVRPVDPVKPVDPVRPVDPVPVPAPQPPNPWWLALLALLFVILPRRK